MKFIKAEEFLKQSEKVKKVLIDWWKPEMYDMFFRDFGNNPNAYMHGVYTGVIMDYETQNNATKDKSFLPLLTENQLRRYIEEKTGVKYDIIYSKGKQEFINFYNMNENEDKPIYKIKGHNLLQAYWQVAIKIAEDI